MATFRAWSSCRATKGAVGFPREYLFDHRFRRSEPRKNDPRQIEQLILPSQRIPADLCLDLHAVRLGTEMGPGNALIHQRSFLRIQLDEGSKLNRVQSGRPGKHGRLTNPLISFDPQANFIEFDAMSVQFDLIVDPTGKAGQTIGRLMGEVARPVGAHLALFHLHGDEP